MPQLRTLPAETLLVPGSHERVRVMGRNKTAMEVMGKLLAHTESIEHLGELGRKKERWRPGPVAQGEAERAERDE